jgi:ribosomal protein S18 acetylase RimI-like enzyme
MEALQVRMARLDDSVSITNLFQASIPVWQRLNAAGQVEDVGYAALSIYERWLYGGPWMSVETTALHLSHLLTGGGIPFVAERARVVVGYVEAYRGWEAEPFADHLHLSQLHRHPQETDSQVAEALIHAVKEAARLERVQRVTASCAANDSMTQALYTAQGFSAAQTVKRYSLPARSGQGFYRMTEHLDANPQQIKGWNMSIGRVESARQHWEMQWPPTFQAIPEIRERKQHRLHISASGQEAFIFAQQQLYVPRSVEFQIWSPKVATAQLMTALRDWSYRENYRTLVMIAPQEIAALLGTEAEADGYAASIFIARI